MEGEALSTTPALAAALSRGDAAAAAALYADDGKLLAPAAELIVGRQQIEAYWETGLDCGLAGVEFDVSELTVGAEMAIEVGRYSLSVNGGGGSGATDRGKYLSLHRLSGSSWSRVVDVFNPDEPGSARRASQGGTR